MRERLLVFAAVTTVLATTWYAVLMQPLAVQTERARSDIHGVRSRIDDTNHALEQQVLQYSSTDEEQQRQMDKLLHRIDEINRQLGDYAAELIDPAEMARVLEDVLRQQPQLKLIHVRNLAAEPLLQGVGADSTTLFRHGLEIEFEGSYFACLEYLEDIESLPWRFYWQLLELDVDQYPRNRIRLKVSTLSLDEEWIGA
jgi:MSHA biogenesis protein MshJ